MIIEDMTEDEYLERIYAYDNRLALSNHWNISTNESSFLSHSKKIIDKKTIFEDLSQATRTIACHEWVETSKINAKIVSEVIGFERVFYYEFENTEDLIQAILIFGKTFDII